MISVGNHAEEVRSDQLSLTQSVHHDVIVSVLKDNEFLLKSEKKPRIGC
jgi:hypothetical protein